MSNQSPYSSVAPADYTCTMGPEEVTRNVILNPITGIMSCTKCVDMFRGVSRIRRHLRSDNHRRQLGLRKKETKDVSSYSLIYII